MVFIFEASKSPSTACIAYSNVHMLLHLQIRDGVTQHHSVVTEGDLACMPPAFAAHTTSPPDTVSLLSQNSMGSQQYRARCLG